MAEKDQGGKVIIRMRPADFITHLLPGAEYLGPLETDVATEPQLVLDTLHGVRYRGIEGAVNIEIQAGYDKDMAQRLFEYGSSAMRIHQRPIASVVLWLHSGGTVPTPPYRVQWGDLWIVDWNFTNIRVHDFSASAMISSGPLGLLPLVPFMGGADEQLSEQAMRRLKEEAPDDQQKTLALILAVFIAQVYKSDDLARAIVRRVFMSLDLFKDSPLYHSLVKEAVEEAAEEARAEGIAQGMRELAQSALEGRFGALDEEVLQALGKADEATLKAVVARVSSDTLEQMRARLGLH
jgi:predicted transposase YdaD